MSSYYSEHLVDDYSRLSWQAQADRILMLKRMYDEKKNEPNLELPSYIFDSGTFPGDSASHYFAKCMKILCDYWGVARIEEDIDQEKYKNKEYIFMLLDFYFLNKLKGHTEEHEERREEIRDYIASTVNRAGNYDTLGAEWDKDNKNLLVVGCGMEIDFNICLKDIITLFRELKKKVEEWK